MKSGRGPQQLISSILFSPATPFALAWLFALVGVGAPGVESSTPWDENALRWMLFLAVGVAAVANSVMHTVFARFTAKMIGWPTSGFQYEVGFANLAVGLAGIYAATQAESEAWVAASIAAGVFLLAAGINHIVEIFRSKNYEPGNTVILISDLGVPISLFVLLITTGAIF